jgi:hypothetical protein
MRSINKFNEPIHIEHFVTYEDATRFTKMLGRNANRFSLIGTHKIRNGWEVVYRARKTSPWLRDPRAKGVA